MCELSVFRLLSVWVILLTNGGLCCEHQHLRPHRCQWSSTEFKQRKGSALLQRVAQQSSQNNLDERKAVWKGIDRTLRLSGSNDDLITELEFTEALSGLSKDTAPGPDKVKYSDIYRTCQ